MFRRPKITKKEMEKTKYTIGIIFEKEITGVVMILKKRPEWQAGKYNFPGGHVEKDETLVQCVSREIKEECGINIPEKDWKHIGFIKNAGSYVVGIFTTIYRPEVHGRLKSAEDQYVCLINSNRFPDNILSNVSWMTQFAINFWKQGNIDNLSFGIFYYTYRG